MVVVSRGGVKIGRRLLLLAISELLQSQSIEFACNFVHAAHILSLVLEGAAQGQMIQRINEWRGEGSCSGITEMEACYPAPAMLPAEGAGSTAAACGKRDMSMDCQRAARRGGRGWRPDQPHRAQLTIKNRECLSIHGIRLKASQHSRSVPAVAPHCLSRRARGRARA